MGTLHPAIVHIPIGLLFAYTLVQLGLVFAPKHKEKMEYGAYVMLVIGLLGGFAALSSGEALEQTVRDTALMEVHAFFASATVWAYGMIAIAETLVFSKTWDMLRPVQGGRGIVSQVYNMLLSLADFFTMRSMKLLLSVLGALLLLFTGALGGALVYGPNADFITSFVYGLFF